MDRIALAKRLEGLSEVFASHTPYNRDLKAMSYVLNKMSDDKFTGVISSDFTEEAEACMCGKGPMDSGVIPVGGPEGLPGAEPKIVLIKKEEGIPMAVEASEKTAGMFWSKDASKAVVDNLLRDVVGMTKSVCCDTGKKLESNQVPNGKHKGIPEKASTLKPEQVPDVSTSLDSGIVEKSHGKVEKDASIADIKADKIKKDKAKAIKTLEKAEKSKDAAEESSKDEEKKEDQQREPVSSIIEGIELSASMDEFELGADEASELSKLFSN